MKILKLIIPNFQQFRNFELDLTHPETGEALEKVCLIGTNGTGKSTILGILDRFLEERRQHRLLIPNETNEIIFFKNKAKNFCHIRSQYICFILNIDELKKSVLNATFLDDAKHFVSIEKNSIRIEEASKELKLKYQAFILTDNDVSYDFEKNTERNNLHIFSPAESITNPLLQIKTVPRTNVNEALKLFGNYDIYHIVSNETIDDFWTQLIYLIKRRQEELEHFANENDTIPYGQIKTTFDQENPEILKAIAVFWNKILDKSNLYFDYENAKNPIQLLDNLQAYIKNKHTNEVVPYNALSTGIRNFMFRLGHIYSLYFNKNIENGFLLVDEPENSLFPDFLYDLIDIYLEIIGKNTQFFVATHNPIIAAQFEPYERVILRFDDEGCVQAHRGEAPVGDDPNDLLEQDFAVRNLMPRQGQQAFKTYLDLRRKLRETTDETKKEDLMTAIATLGRLYNF